MRLDQFDLKPGDLVVSDGKTFLCGKSRPGMQYLTEMQTANGYWESVEQEVSAAYRPTYTIEYDLAEFPQERPLMRLEKLQPRACHQIGSSRIAERWNARPAEKVLLQVKAVLVSGITDIGGGRYAVLSLPMQLFPSEMVGKTVLVKVVEVEG